MKRLARRGADRAVSVGPDRPWRLIGIVLVVWLAGCAPSAPVVAPGQPAADAAPPSAAVAAPPPPAPTPPVAATPLPVLPFDEAVLSAATGLLGQSVPAGGAGRHTLVIDPLIDGLTGTQSAATQAIGAKLAELVRGRYPQYELQPFNSSTLSKSPLVLIGTFTGVNAERKTEGLREAYRICLALADLKTGKLVGKGLAFAAKDGVDLTPVPFYRDAPGWIEDAATTGYVRSCQGTRSGDPIHPAYLEGIENAARIGEAAEAYAKGRYADAHKLYTAAAEAPAGRQLRVLNGLYLTNWRLGRSGAAAKAFGDIVDQGLETRRLGVKFLFKAGTTVLSSDPKGPPVPYAMWLREIGSRATRQQSCLEVVGHASPVGPESVNERVSLRRAEQIRTELLRTSAPLAKRVIATGAGSREALIGNGRDDASDALDRRVEFKVVAC